MMGGVGYGISRKILSSIKNDEAEGQYLEFQATGG